MRTVHRSGQIPAGGFVRLESPRRVPRAALHVSLAPKNGSNSLWIRGHPSRVDSSEICFRFQLSLPQALHARLRRTLMQAHNITITNALTLPSSPSSQGFATVPINTWNWSISPSTNARWCASRQCTNGAWTRACPAPHRWRNCTTQSSRMRRDLDLWSTRQTLQQRGQTSISLKKGTCTKSLKSRAHILRRKATMQRAQ